MGRPDPETLHRLRWQCRRGMLELDDLLTRYLERRYSQAPEGEQAAFRRLLEQQDPDLQRWLLLQQRPADRHLCVVVEQILRLEP